MKFPKDLYVRIEKDNDNEWLLCEEELIDAIDGNGPTTVGVYRLVETVVGKKHVTTKVTTKKAKN